MLTCGGYSSWGRFSACIHSIHPRLCGTKDGSSIICQHNSQSSRQDFTAPAQKPLSAFINPLPTPGQGKVGPRLHLQGQPQPRVTRAMGTQSGSPSPLHAWGLSPAHTPSWPRCWHQPLPYLPQSLFLSCMATRSWARPNPPKGSPER